MTETINTATFEWFRDNPSTWWDGDIRTLADWFADNEYTPTAYLRTNVAPDRLREVPGKMGEHLRENDPTEVAIIDRLCNSMQQRGYVGGRVLICVERDGSPFVYEGNHRIRAAAQVGLDAIPVEVRYMAGSETLIGVWRPMSEPLPIMAPAVA